ncbi:hypothetical protein [Candidatus Thiosymbion oneisti]|nr:hypothetical protein [Candidatus Thiosymbion oneisti]
MLAKKAVEQVEPSELPLFDQVWQDFEDDPEQPIAGADPASRIYGFGGVGELPFVSALIIPIVVHFLGSAAEKGVDWLVNKIKEDQKGAKDIKLSEEQIRKIAEVLVRHGRNSGGNS